MNNWLGTTKLEYHSLVERAKIIFEDITQIHTKKIVMLMGASHINLCRSNHLTINVNVINEVFFLNKHEKIII